VKARTVLISTAVLVAALLPMPPASAHHAPDLYVLKVRNSGKCLHQQDATQADGGRVTQWDCLDAPYARVRLQGLSDGDGPILIQFEHSAKCVHIHGGGSANDTAITQWTCPTRNEASTKPHMFWKLVRAPVEGHVHVTSYKYPRKCLHLHGGAGNNGDPVTLWDCVDAPNVHWQVVRHS
jgi:hypothetical protein